MNFWVILFSIVLVIIWIVAGGFTTQASVFLTPYKDTNNSFNQAYWYTTIVAVLTWLLVGIFIILVILAIVGVTALFGTGVGEAGAAVEAGEVEAAESSSALENLASKLDSGQISKLQTGFSWFSIGFLIFALGLVITTGVLSSIAASDLHGVIDHTVPNQVTAYNDCTISAIMSLTAAGLLIVGFITYVTIFYLKRGKLEEKQKQLMEIKEREVEDIDKIKRRTTLQRVERSLPPSMTAKNSVEMQGMGEDVEEEPLPSTQELHKMIYGTSTSSPGTVSKNSVEMTRMPSRPPSPSGRTVLPLPCSSAHPENCSLPTAYNDTVPMKTVTRSNVAPAYQPATRMVRTPTTKTRPVQVSTPLGDVTSSHYHGESVSTPLGTLPKATAVAANAKTAVDTIHNAYHSAKDAIQTATAAYHEAAEALNRAGLYQKAATAGKTAAVAERVL